MACSIIQSSSSSSAPMTLRRNYDVFVSFRGTDTRYNFTDHLFSALQRKSVLAFRDDTKLKKGESIAPELLRAIEGSQVFVVVFSKNYASSTWCLRELENILDCVQVSGKRVLPIFYDVDPSEVRHQKGSFAEAFKEHEERFKQESEIVQRWREALTHVANLSGWDIRDKPQDAEIQKIVEEIIDILDYKFSSLPNDLVGICTPIEELENLLHLDSVDDVRVVGISGMGGIGKTTLATVLCGRISRQFNACCFIDDLSRIYRRDGPIGAQKQILHQTQGGEHLQICNIYDGANLIRSRLRRVRALIILDNVDDAEQLEKTALNREWLGAGSRIIIISRDAHILEEYGVDVRYKVPILDRSYSCQLFCRKAFKRNSIMSNYEKLASEILDYADGLPLAIKVLGSFLYGRNISEWRSALVRRKESPNRSIMDVLRLSFDGLEETEKDIFLDIACFFHRSSAEYVKNVLNCCGFYPDIGLRRLIDKSLITIEDLCLFPGEFLKDVVNCAEIFPVFGLRRLIDKSLITVEDEMTDRSWIFMHGLLQELGKNIVHENSVKERKWSRLWLKEHFNSVTLESMEKNVKAIVFASQGEILQVLMAEQLSEMNRLRLLILHDVDFSGSLIGLSSELRYIEWQKYPFKYLPSSFQPNQLVELILRHSSIKILWEDKKYLPNLKTLDLSDSINLVKTPNFGEMPNLERLILEGCVKLALIDRSIGLLRKLFLLNLKGCKNLVSIPNNIFRLSSLKDVNLSGCSKVVNNLWTVEMPSTMKWIMLPSISCFTCLRELDISFCGLNKIPDSIGCIRCLERLNLMGNDFVTLPSLKELSKLVYLNLQHCKLLKSLPELPSPATVEQYYRIFSFRRFFRRLGLYIFNCPELVKSEQSNRMTLSWMTQFIQANQEHSASFHQLDIVIPGSEIPTWFNNRSVDDSPLSVDLSPIMQDNNNFIGVACYVVFSVAPDDSSNITKPFIRFIFNREGHYDWDARCFAPVDLVAVKSNHMWLCYFYPESLIDMLTCKDIGITRKCVSMDTKALHVEVKNFGYRWVFKQDLQVMHCGNLLSQKRKFLAIEDEVQPQP